MLKGEPRFTLLINNQEAIVEAKPGTHKQRLKKQILIFSVRIHKNKVNPLYGLDLLQISQFLAICLKHVPNNRDQLPILKKSDQILEHSLDISESMRFYRVHWKLAKKIDRRRFLSWTIGDMDFRFVKSTEKIRWTNYKRVQALPVSPLPLPRGKIHSRRDSPETITIEEEEENNDRKAIEEDPFTELISMKEFLIFKNRLQYETHTKRYLRRPEKDAQRMVFHQLLIENKFITHIKSTSTVAKECQVVFTPDLLQKISQIDLNVKLVHRYTRPPPGSICILDCEMVQCGKHQEVISIAILDIQGQVLLDARMKPPGRITNAHSEIHNMSQEYIEAMRPAHKFKNFIEETLQDKIIVGYAIDADLKALEVTGFNIEYDEKIDISFFPAFRRKEKNDAISLEQLVFEIFEAGMPFFHNALIDTIATAELYKLFQEGIDTEQKCRQKRKKFT